MKIREHRTYGHGLRPGTTRDLGCPNCKREDADPSFTPVIHEDGDHNWAGPGFTRRNDESAK